MFLDERKLNVTPRGSLAAHGWLQPATTLATVQGRVHPRSLASVVPHRASMLLHESDASLHGFVALADSSGADAEGTFKVYADGRPVFCSPRVRAGEPPRPITVNLSGAEALELVAEGKGDAHFVWLDTYLSSQKINEWRGTFGDVRVELPDKPLRAKRCIFTVMTPGYVKYLVMMARSLYERGNVRDAKLVVLGFGLEEDAEAMRVIEHYNVHLVRCRHLDGHRHLAKTATLAIPFVVDADAYLMLDGDILVMGDLSEMFTMAGALPPVKMAVAQDGNWREGQDLLCHLHSTYVGDIVRDRAALGIEDDEAFAQSMINSGVYVGQKEAFLALESLVRSFMPQSARWDDDALNYKIDGKFLLFYREQFFINQALLRGDMWVELNRVFNFQAFDPAFPLNHRSIQQIDLMPEAARPRILHFNSPIMREKYKPLLDSYSELSRERMPFGGS